MSCSIQSCEFVEFPNPEQPQEDNAHDKLAPIFFEASSLLEVELETLFLCRIFEVEWPDFTPHRATVLEKQFDEATGSLLTKQQRDQCHSGFARLRHKKYEELIKRMAAFQKVCQLIVNDGEYFASLRERRHVLHQDYLLLLQQLKNAKRPDCRNNLKVKLRPVKRQLEQLQLLIRDSISKLRARGCIDADLPEWCFRILGIDTGQAAKLPEAEFSHPPWLDDWLVAVLAGQNACPPATYRAFEAIANYMNRSENEFIGYCAKWSPPRFGDHHAVHNEVQIRELMRLPCNAAWWAVEMEFKKCPWLDLFLKGWKSHVEDSAYGVSATPNSKKPCTSQKVHVPSDQPNPGIQPAGNGAKPQPRGLPQLPECFDKKDPFNSFAELNFDEELNNQHAGLSQVEKAVLRLREEFNCSFREISEKLGIKIGKVRTHYQTGLWKLRKTKADEWFQQQGLTDVEKSVMKQVFSEVEVPERVLTRWLLEKLSSSEQGDKQFISATYEAGWNKLFGEAEPEGDAEPESELVGAAVSSNSH